MADFINKLKTTFGFTEDYEYEDFEEEQYGKYEEPKQVEPRVSKIKNTLNLSATKMIITVHEPLSYEESPNIVDDLRENKSVVLNFEQLNIDIKRKIFDFISGAIYALDGKIQKVNKDIFIVAPNNVEIDGLKKELKDSGMFPW